MAVQYILGALALIFLFAAALRIARFGGLSHPQTRTWLLISFIFGVVSAWLSSRN